MHYRVSLMQEKNRQNCTRKRYFWISKKWSNTRKKSCSKLHIPTYDLQFVWRQYRSAFLKIIDIKIFHFWNIFWVRKTNKWKKKQGKTTSKQKQKQNISRFEWVRKRNIIWFDSLSKVKFFLVILLISGTYLTSPLHVPFYVFKQGIYFLLQGNLNVYILMIICSKEITETYLELSRTSTM